ncbi:Rieske 2Fe-2S domain-containing protein [Pseudonocardia sp. CA-142604]|uniref:Rieske 2Fe-2S domain-containing protein n=1 Tax=Pseudonocardia sp. CA-142604 TaxID=3240024 RepID=UPI003D940473
MAPLINQSAPARPVAELDGSPAGWEEIVLLNVGVEIWAFGDHRLHLGSHLSEGDLAGGTLTCAKHPWEFDALTGKGANPTNCEILLVSGRALGAACPESLHPAAATSRPRARRGMRDRKRTILRCEAHDHKNRRRFFLHRAAAVHHTGDRRCRLYGDGRAA